MVKLYVQITEPKFVKGCRRVLFFVLICVICFIFRLGTERYVTGTSSDRERLSLTSLEVITDALLEIMEVCFVPYLF